MKQRKQRIAEFVESVKGENITDSTIILGGAKNDSYGLNCLSSVVFACTARDFKTEDRLGHLHDDGKIEWNLQSVKDRNSVKFSKPLCRDCRIAPICAGGCRTKCMEHSHHNECNNGYTEDDIDDLILERFEYFFL